jgi:hypothetical protein
MGKFHVSAARTGCCSPKRRSRMCKRESNRARQPFSYRGDGNFARHAPRDYKRTVVDRSIRSFASESRGTRQQFSHRGIGIVWVRTLPHVHYKLSTAQASQGKKVSHFPIGAMGTFEHERAHRQLCWNRSGSSRWPLCLH